MKSKTSFFNRTVFKKNVTLYWPIWVCYLLYGMVKVPGQLWSRLQQQTDMTAYARDYALYNSLRLEVDVAAIAIMAVVCGMALFGYLFTQKNAYMIHALPVTRGELYVTNMISGLCFLLIPQALVFLVTVVLCLLKGIASVQFLGLWFLSVMGIAFFLYATVCFCVMFTGQLFALPVYFLAVNYVAFAFSSGARYVIGYLGYGLGMDTVPEFLILRILSPMNYLYNNVRFVFRQSYNQETDLMSGNMLDRAPQENGTLDYCHENGIGFISFSPLAQGLLTDRYLNGIPSDSRMAKEHFLKHSALTPELIEQLKQWNAEAGERGETLAEMALAWILQQKGVTSVLVGASSTAQLEKNIKCVHAKAF